jgi:hypothetical protein
MPDVASDALKRAVIEALRGGRDLHVMLEALAPGQISEQQRTALELLEALRAAEEDDAKAAAAVEPASVPDDDVQHELADLREVNDTCAAALGACRICWGGDAGCPRCAGRGRAGASLPDPELFDALVAPAVRRMASARARHRRPDARAPRSPSTEGSS